MHSERGFLSLEQGRHPEAVGAFTRAADLAGAGSKPQGALGYALARLGERERAEGIAREMELLAEQHYVPRMGLALVHIGLGDRDAAFEQLERAFAQHDPGLVYLAIKPGFQDLRGDPRFADLLKRLGLPQTEEVSSVGSPARTLASWLAARVSRGDPTSGATQSLLQCGTGSAAPLQWAM